MCEVYVHTKFYIGKEPKTMISFELSKTEWDELEKTDAWKSVERFLERKRNGIPNEFDVLKAIANEKKISDLEQEVENLKNIFHTHLECHEQENKELQKIIESLRR